MAVKAEQGSILDEFGVEQVAIEDISNISGKLDRLYLDYGCRARELKSLGSTIIGYLCAYVPVEIITAAGFVPFRLRGDVKEPITMADTRMETIVCSLVRSCFDLSLKGKYDFIDGLVIPHACDSICRSYDIWTNSFDLPYSHLLNVPHSTDESSLEFFKSILNTFRKSLGEFAGRPISDYSLASAIGLHNKARLLVKELYGLRKTDPPLISGVDNMRTLMAISSVPVDESIGLLDQLLADVRQKTGKSEKQPRIMIVGAQIDNTDFIELIENVGASVVVDDLCPGTREYWPEVRVTDDPLDGMAERYLIDIMCSRTYREMKNDYRQYLEDRFGHIGRMARDFNVHGVVLLVYRYCDPFGFEVPQLKSYLDSLSIPVLYIEDEYPMLAKARIRTRIQAFLESFSAFA